MTDPAKLISIMQVILKELEQTLSTAPQPTNESNHTGEIQNRIDRLDLVLKKRKAADLRRREIERNNRDINRPSKKG